MKNKFYKIAFLVILVGALIYAQIEISEYFFNDNNPIEFTKEIPSSIKLIDEINLSFKVDTNLVSKYRFKLNHPGVFWHGIAFNILNWSDWYANMGTNILFHDHVKEGKYEFIIEYEEKSTNKKKIIKKEFFAHWEDPEFKLESFTINEEYINAAENEGEKFRRASEEWLASYNIWIKKFEYEYSLFNKQKESPSEIITILAEELVLKSTAILMQFAQTPPVYIALLKGIGLATLVKKGISTVVLIYRYQNASIAANMASLSYAKYLVYENEYLKLRKERNILDLKPFVGVYLDERTSYTLIEEKGKYYIKGNISDSNLLLIPSENEDFKGYYVKYHNAHGDNYISFTFNKDLNGDYYLTFQHDVSDVAFILWRTDSKIPKNIVKWLNENWEHLCSNFIGRPFLTDYFDLNGDGVNDYFYFNYGCPDTRGRGMINVLDGKTYKEIYYDFSYNLTGMYNREVIINDYKKKK